MNLFDFSWQSKPLGQPWHSLAMVLVALILTSGSIYFYVDSREFIQRSTETSGVVIQLVANRDNRFASKVSFKDATGKVITFRSSSSSNPASYVVGEKITVMYDPLSPDDARIKGFMDLWFFSVLLGGLGIAFLTGAIILWIYRHTIYALSGHPKLAGRNKRT